MKRFGWLVLILLLSVQGYGQVSFGKPEKINEGWLFTLNDPENAQSQDFAADGWQNITLPHDWSVKGRLSPTLASCTGYLPGGIGWYRKAIEIPADKRGEKVYLYFEGAYNRSQVYFNGHLLGERPNGYVSFMYDATPYVQYGNENIVAVRVDHSRSADSRWYTGSGIYRDAWLVYANPVHIAQWGVFAYPSQADTRKGVLKIETEIENGSDAAAQLTVMNELFDAQGISVAKNSKKLSVPTGQKGIVEQELQLRNPKLWDLDTPNLYTLKTTVSQHGRMIDQTETKTGFRSFTFDPDKGFALNGEWMKMKGVCLHHDAGVLGSAVPKDVWKRRLINLKELGCNAIRTSHNPQAPDLYALADELGMLVLNEAYDEWEFPKRKWLEGWNVGKPGYEGSYDFFEQWGEKDLADFVRRDRNHLSVFAWSIGNEVDYPNDPYALPGKGRKRSDDFTQAFYGDSSEAPNAHRLGDIAKRLVKVVKQYDRSRPTTAGLAGVSMSNETEYPGALDITGYNYTESRYLSDHEKYPNRVIYGSENRHEKAPWDAVTDNEHIFGQFLWTGIDYLGESHAWPSRGFNSGLLDFGGSVKPRGYFRQSLWSTEPMAYIGTYPTPSGSRERTPSMDAWPVWNYRDGEQVRVVCYTNADQAKLLLNGQTVGEVKPYDKATGIIYWDIPFEKGKLEVVAMDAAGMEAARNAIETSGRPHALAVCTSDTEISKDRGVAHVVIQVVDENGIPVMISDEEVACVITGPARLLGLEASNNSDMGDYTDNKQRVFNGRILAYVEAAGEAGEVKVSFTSPWLQSAEHTIAVK